MGKRKSAGGDVEEPMEVDRPQTNGHCGDGAHPSTSNGDGGEDDDMDHISDDEEGGIRIGDIYIPPAPKPTLSMEADGPRLIITDIVNENFKSYAGTERLGPFHKVSAAITYKFRL